MSRQETIIIPSKTDIGALGNRINSETRKCHERINKEMAIKFPVAIYEPKVYRQGIQMFYHIFKAIEDSLSEEINKNTHYSDMLRKIWRPELSRTGRLHKDLMLFYGGRPAKFESPILKKQIQSTEHIKQIAIERPYLLLAYMHVLYLALFAGGQFMYPKVAQSKKLFPGASSKNFEAASSDGTNFFRFDVENPQKLRAAYKQDYELQTRNFLSEQEKEEVIEESKVAFDMICDGINEIESHNLNVLRQKTGFRTYAKSNFLVILLATLIVYCIVRAIVFRTPLY